MKIPHIHRYSPSPLNTSVGAFWPTDWTMKKNEIQNAPYEQNATAPNVFPVRNSHSPATNCAMPP